MTDEQAKKELSGKMFELTLECEAEKSEKRKRKISSEFAAILRADAALEKQIPKKPFYDKNRDDFNAYKCPVCNDEYMILSGDNYCTVCGQALDWSDNE